MLTFEPGDLGWLLDIPIVRDSLDEPNETFSLRLGLHVGWEHATIADDTGIATIIDDDEPAPPAAPPDTSPPDVNAPAVDFARGRSLGKGKKPIPLAVSFSASDPSGISATKLQHRTGSGAYVDVARKAPAARTLQVRPVSAPPPEVRPAAGTSATVKVGTKAKVVHRFRSQATDGVGNTSAFANAPPCKVKVVQDGSRSIKQKGRWTTKRSKAYFGRTVRQATKKGAMQKLSAKGTDFAIVATRGKDKGKAKVIVDGKPVGTVDLYAKKTKPKSIVYTVSFPKPGKHSIVLKALGKKHRKSKGTRVELDAFLVLTP